MAADLLGTLAHRDIVFSVRKVADERQVDSRMKSEERIANGASKPTRGGLTSSGSGQRPAIPGHFVRSEIKEDIEMKVERVFERVYERRRLRLAWERVRSNAGAAGIDMMTVDEFAKREDELLTLIAGKLMSGSYRFKPAKRVLIPKAGSKKKRKLGIPVVMDRVVCQSLHTVLEELWDADFTRQNFGYRRGKSQHQAIGHVREIVAAGYTWCAAVDLASFFDEIPHSLVFQLIRRKVRDEKLVTLIARALKAGVIVDGVFEKTLKGCPQGSPVSPILSNIVLNELDQELESRGHRYCRWADDFIILLKSERAANRVMDSVTEFLEDTLGLPVNREKSQVAPIKGVEFLGFSIFLGKIRVSTKARKRFKDRVRQLTRRNNGQSMVVNIQRLNVFLRGWMSYYRIQEFKQVFGQLDAFIRSRLRSMQLKKWKKPAKFQRMLIRAGYAVRDARRTWIKMDKWQSVMRLPVRFVFSLQWFRRQGLLFLDDFTQRNLKLPFAC